jgi:hypothetical protein
MTSQTKYFVSFGEMNPFVFAVLAASETETDGRPMGDGRSDGFSKARKKFRGSALKSLKQLVRVNLCATPRERSEADDSR